MWKAKALRYADANMKRSKDMNRYGSYRRSLVLDYEIKCPIKKRGDQLCRVEEKEKEKK